MPAGAVATKPPAKVYALLVVLPKTTLPKFCRVTGLVTERLEPAKDRSKAPLPTVRLDTAKSAKKFMAVEALVRSKLPTGVGVDPLNPTEPRKVAVSAWLTFTVPTPCPMVPVIVKLPEVFKVRLALAPVETLRAKLPRVMAPELPEPKVSVAVGAAATSPTTRFSVPASRLEVPASVTLPKVIF